MPYLNLKLSGPPSTETTRLLAAALADLTTGILGKKREVTSVAVEFVRGENWFVGGPAVAEQDLATFYLDVKITAGTNTKDEKAAYIRQVFEVLAGHLGPVHPASYIVVHEVGADAWGYQGLTQERRYIQGRVL